MSEQEIVEAKQIIYNIGQDPSEREVHYGKILPHMPTILGIGAIIMATTLEYCTHKTTEYVVDTTLDVLLYRVK
jgi:hypothetical protein